MAKMFITVKENQVKGVLPDIMLGLDSSIGALNNVKGFVRTLNSNLGQVSLVDSALKEITTAKNAIERAEGRLLGVKQTIEEK